MRSLAAPLISLAALAAVFAIVATRARPPVPPLFPKFMGVSSPPLSVADELKTFQLAEPELKIECAASEPMVEAPVAAQFDERGRLWVVEMRTYMPDIEGTGELEKRNRISILEDLNGDGIFDKSTVFMDDLVLPRAAAPCFDGALVIEPPNLLFCRDTTGDGKADERTVLATGFAGLESPEHAGNGLLYGLDGWYHCSQHKEEFRVGIEFRGLEPEKINIETRATPGSIGQWGITQDKLGRLYYTPNSNPLIVDLYPKFWARLNSNFSEVRGVGVNIAPSECWPIHPTPGANRGYQPDTLRKDGTLANVTAACGPVILTDSLLGAQYENNAFICDAVGNLVKRFKLEETDKGPKAVNAYKKREFLASTDERFRPVNTVEGPDGSLYIIDMYRGVIQHKTFETNYLKEQYKKRNLETPINMGRIWRIARHDQKAAPQTSFEGASAAELTSNLSSSNTWLRLQSIRLINRSFFGSAKEGNKTESVDWNILKEIALDPKSPGALPANLMILERPAAGSAIRPPVLTDDEICSTPPGRLAFALYHTSRITQGMPSEAITRFEHWANEPPEPTLIPYISAALAQAPQYDFLLDFLAGPGNTDAARSAAISRLKGGETLLLNVAWNHRDANELKAFIRDLFSCSMSSEEMRSRTLNLAARAPEKLRNDLLDRIKNDLRIGTASPRTMKVSQEPLEFTHLGEGESEVAAKVNDISKYLLWPGKPVSIPPIRPLTDEEQARFDRGRDLLYSHCATCHQADGKGAPGQAPSLAGSAYVNGPPQRLAKIMLHGLQGEYEVNGQKYAGAMPVPPGVGSEADIANILTFIRRSFGNTADPVDQQTVSKVRRENAKRFKAWSRQELDRER